MCWTCTSHLKKGTNYDTSCYIAWLAYRTAMPSWPSLSLKLTCATCGALAERTGRTTLSARAGKELCGVGSSPRLRNEVDTSETYRLHAAIPSLNQVKLD